ncbi:unnamed protein product [Paramecium primaurelia]|uniref:Uncharacterized protein n=1 Tax=Paramecium primaurelia TaxID=5886 RepID=A0A8S1QIC0_PARPR|nr:unnamed protein product [Paramecium primaurelia]
MKLRSIIKQRNFRIQLVEIIFIKTNILKRKKFTKLIISYQFGFSLDQNFGNKSVSQVPQYQQRAQTLFRMTELIIFRIQFIGETEGINKRTDLSQQQKTHLFETSFSMTLG